MLKEIFEQPNSIRDSIRGRMSVSRSEIKMSGIDDHWEKWDAAQRILIIACGTSWHAGLVAEYLFEDFARIPVEVEYASEFRYRNPIIRPDDVVIAISQSGETADTLAAIQLAKRQGAHVFGVCNVVGSSIARETDSGAYTHAGPEIGVASTKAFTAQLTVLTLIAMLVGKKKGSCLPNGSAVCSSSLTPFRTKSRSSWIKTRTSRKSRATSSTTKTPFTSVVV